MRWILIGAVLGVAALFVACALCIFAMWLCSQSGVYADIIGWIWPIAVWAAIGGVLGYAYDKNRRVM